MPNSEGEFREGKWIRFKYNVSTLSLEKQLVEVHWYGDHYSGMSRYIAEDNRVDPLYSRLMGIGHMFRSIPFAGAFGLMLYFVGQWLRKRYRTENRANI